MLLSSGVKETVIQLHVQQAGDYLPVGHAFYLNLLEGEQVFSYLVASRHILAGLAQRGTDIFVPAHRPAGSPAEFVRLSASWVNAADPAVDLALAPRVDDAFPAGTAAISADWIATEARLAGRLVEGLEVLFVRRLEPPAGLGVSPAIVRQGHLALAPAQPLPGPGGPADYLLVECGSQPTDSGAPLFMAAQAPDGQATLALLGVVAAPYTPGAPTSSGLTLVTPAQCLLDLLRQDELARLRRSGRGAGRLRRATPHLREN